MRRRHHHWTTRGWRRGSHSLADLVPEHVPHFMVSRDWTKTTHLNGKVGPADNHEFIIPSMVLGNGLHSFIGRCKREPSQHLPELVTSNTSKLGSNTLNETSFGGIQYHHDGINSHDSRVKKMVAVKATRLACKISPGVLVMCPNVCVYIYIERIKHIL